MSDEGLIELCTLSFEGCFWWLQSSMLRALETLKTWVQCALAGFASKLLTRKLHSCPCSSVFIPSVGVVG